MKKVKLMVVGAGGRGRKYASLAAKAPGKVEIVAVAEPRRFHREALARECRIPEDRVFTCWREAVIQEKIADAVAICTQDDMHVEPALAFVEKGYHILLEKPIAPTAKECETVVHAALDHQIILAVCHVMRYTKYTRTVKEIVDSGRIGDIVGIQHLEPVGYWHYAHSYVRGNWRKEAESSSVLLAKSCHDLDWIRYVMDAPCENISSFGSLNYFKKENQPAGAADRCVNCGVESSCPYSAKRFYLNRLRTKQLGWPLDVISPEMTKESVDKALREGPYGRCVFACDNDVLDNQVVNMTFTGGRVASFSLMACSEYGGRRTTIFGTKGELVGDGSKLRLFDFLTNQHQEIDTNAGDMGFVGGHGGGDTNVLSHFIDAVASGDSSHILTGPQVSLESHLMVFAAEKARKENRVIDMAGFVA